MDNIKVRNSRFNELNIKSFLNFLNRKSLQKLSNTNDSFSTSISQSPSEGLESPAGRSSFTFRVQSFQIQEHVEYVVEMRQCYKVLGRRVCNRTTFRTRYSMLEKLNLKLNKESFPRKKLFGNKDAKFVKQRSQKLEQFLNEISAERSAQFLKFVKQIKDADFNKELNGKFELK